MMKHVNLNDVCKIIAGQSPPSSTYNKESQGLPFFQGKADFGETYPNIRMWCSVPKKISLPNDILISVRAPVGPTNINNIESCIGRGLSAIRCSKKIELRFLLHFLRSNEKKIADKGTGSTFKAITQKDLKVIQVPLPPLPVQQKIATILDSADALKQKDKALIAKYNELCQSLFLDMFGDPVTNPKEFSKMKLSDFCEFENGDRSSNYPSKGETTKHGKLFLSSGDIIGGKFIVKASKFISEEKFNSLTRGKCHRGDILMTLRGNGLGRSGVFDCEFHEGFINAQMVILRPNSECLNNYLVFQLNCPPVFKRLLKISSGSAQPQLTAGNVKLFEVLVPPIDLQNQFTERIQAIEQQKQQAQASLKKSEDLFNCLLQKAFKGELVT